MKKPEVNFVLGNLGEYITRLAYEAGEWSDETFGKSYGRGPEACIAHLKKEILELEKEPYDREEFADCMLLLMDAYRRAGGNIEDLFIATREKLEICKKRKWGKPDENGVVEHVDEEKILEQTKKDGIPRCSAKYIN